MFSLSSVTKNQIQKAVGLSMSQIFALDSASEKVFVETKNASPLVFSKNRVGVISGRGNSLLARRKIKTLSDLERQSKKLFGI